MAFCWACLYYPPIQWLLSYWWAPQAADITPTVPVATCGRFRLVIAKTVETPLTVNVVALESREGGRSLDAAVMVSCDLAYIAPKVLPMVREEVHNRLPDLDLKKIFLNATHTHTAPATALGQFVIPKGVLPVEDYLTFLAKRTAEAIEKAWNSRKPGSVAGGLGYAVVAQNRLAVFADGHAEMLGNTGAGLSRH